MSRVGKWERFERGKALKCSDCGFGIVHRIGLDHMIAASAVGLAGSMDDYYDVPKLPSIVPSFLLPYSGRMNFAERTINFLVVALADLFSWELGRKYKEVWNRFGIITDDEFYKSKINYLLSNSDEFLEFGRPTSPKIVHIGGITALEAAPLSQKLQRIMERTKMGAVYISFGSIPSTKEMPKHFRDAIVEVAKTFENYDFIWKVDEEDTIQNVSNLHTFSWVSQRALL
ncbi:hypothetical protein OSTOST_02904, partial [Ostertagia ostertagi]